MKRKLKRSKLYRLITTNERRKRLVIASIGLFFISFMSIGFAYLSETLTVEGTAVVGGDLFVNCTEVVVNEMTNGGSNTYKPNHNKNTITMTSTLPNLNSTVIYKVTFRNYSLEDIAELESIIEDSLSNDKMTYEITGLRVKSTIDTTTTIDAYIEFKYKETTTELPEDKTVGLITTFNFKVHEDEAEEYVADGLLLNLRGLDSPINNIWYDAENGREMKLNNVIYNSTNKSYYFNGSGYATLEESILPITGNFTLEARVSYPENIKTVTDQAIVSQVHDETNDVGRIKINAAVRNGSNQLLVFNNDKTSNNNIFTTFTTNPNLGKTYLLQVVRTDTQLVLYLDGVKVNAYNFNASSPISNGPFKLGRWNDASNQYYNGSINSVRVYNKALTEDELEKNMLADDKNYYIEPPKIENMTLKEYAINNQLVPTGEGLYIDNLNRAVYRGTTVNNYLKFKDSDILYRIINYNEDGTMKILDTTNRINIPFDESGNRSRTSSTYCDKSSTIADASLKLNYGCNVWGAYDNFANLKLSGTVANEASSNVYLNTVYYNSLPASMKDKIIEHEFNVGVGLYSTTRDNQNTQSTTLKWSGKIGLLTSADLLNTSINNTSLSNGSNANFKGYLHSLQNSTDMFWTMTTGNENSYDIFVLLQGSQIALRRASRYNQIVGSTTYNFYALPAYYVNAEVKNVSGNGTEKDPFIIN